MQNKSYCGVNHNHDPTGHDDIEHIDPMNNITRIPPVNNGNQSLHVSNNASDNIDGNYTTNAGIIVNTRINQGQIASASRTIEHNVNRSTTDADHTRTRNRRPMIGSDIGRNLFLHSGIRPLSDFHETESLASRSFHMHFIDHDGLSQKWNTNTTSKKATIQTKPTRSFSTLVAAATTTVKAQAEEEKKYLEQDIETLLDLCHRKNWEAANRRARSYPHEAKLPLTDRVPTSRPFFITKRDNHSKNNNMNTSDSINSNKKSSNYNGTNTEINGVDRNNATSSNNNSNNSNREAIDAGPLITHIRVPSFYQTGTTPLSIACKNKAPIETIIAITHACPLQLRYPRRPNSTCCGTPLHEVICNDSSLELDVIEFLVSADEQLNLDQNTRSRQDRDGDKKSNYKKGEHNSNETHNDSDNNNKTIGDNTEKYSNNVTTKQQQQGQQQQDATPFDNHLDHLEQHCFTLKSTCQQDSSGCTALHRWIYRILDCRLDEFLSLLIKSPDEYNLEKVGNEKELIVKNSEDILKITRIIVEAYPQASAITDRSGKTPLAIALQSEPNKKSNFNNFGSCLMENHIFEMVRIMAEAYPPSVQVTCSSYGYNSLHRAIISRRMKTTRVLLEACPEATQISNNVGELPLHTAASMGAPLKLMELILHAGPEAAAKEDRGGRTALHWIWIRYITAVYSSSSLDDHDKNHMNLIPQMIAPVSAKNRRIVPNEWNALQESWFLNLKNHINDEKFKAQIIKSQFWSAAELLLNAVYSPDSNHANLVMEKRMREKNNTTKKISFLMIHAAIAASCPRSFIRLALMLYPDSVHIRDNKGQLPIHIAASSPINGLWKFDESECSAMELLLKASPPSAEIRDSSGRLPIHIAIDFEKNDAQKRKRKGRRPLLGKPIQGNVATLMHFCPQSLSTKDGKGHGMLCPFMLAGCGSNANLNVSYQLLRAAPEAIDNVLLQSKYREVQPLTFVDPVQKRQRLPLH